MPCSAACSASRARSAFTMAATFAAARGCCSFTHERFHLGGGMPMWDARHRRGLKFGLVGRVFIPGYKARAVIHFCRR